MKNKKRILIYIVLIIVSFWLQTTVVYNFILGTTTPNILLIITASIGFMRGKKEGLITGFFCGLLIDVLYNDVNGIYAMIYMLIGYGNGFFQRLFYDDDIKLPLLLIGVSELIYGISIFFFMFALKSKFEFPHYLFHNILPELVYTILVTLIFYQLIRKLNHWIENEEKRSGSKFV